MEQVQITLRRAKRNENRVQGDIVFLNSGGRNEITAPNEPTFWKIVNGILRKHEFMGVYPENRAEQELFMKMIGTPKKVKFQKAFRGAEPCPTTEALLALDHTALQKVCHKYDISANGSKEAMISRLRAHLIRDLGFLNTESPGYATVISSIIKKAEPEPAPELVKPPLEDLKSYPRKKLQGVCEQFGIEDISGNPIELIARILGEVPEKIASLLGKEYTPPAEEDTPPVPDEWEQYGRKELQTMCEDKGLSTEGGSKVEFIERLKVKQAEMKRTILTVDELLFKGKKELGRLLDERNLEAKGKKHERIAALTGAEPEDVAALLDDENYLVAVKRRHAQEEADRKAALKKAHDEIEGVKFDDGEEDETYDNPADQAEADAIRGAALTEDEELTQEELDSPENAIDEEEADDAPPIIPGGADEKKTVPASFEFPTKDEIEAMDYKDMKRVCKEKGLGAKGKKTELIQKLLDDIDMAKAKLVPTKDPVENNFDAEGATEAQRQATFEKIVKQGVPEAKAKEMIWPKNGTKMYGQENDE